MAATDKHFLYWQGITNGGAVVDDNQRTKLLVFRVHKALLDALEDSKFVWLEPGKQYAVCVAKQVKELITGWCVEGLAEDNKEVELMLEIVTEETLEQVTFPRLSC